MRYDGAIHTLAFDGEALGLSPGVSIDAVALLDGGDLVLSFDTTAALPPPILCRPPRRR